MKITLQNEDALKSDILQRFLRYVKVCTTSDPRGTTTPTTQCQWDLAKMLVDEIKCLGITDVLLTDHCYVIARIAANTKRNVMPIGFLAHLDTSPDVNGENVNPVYERESGIIRTDGKTLLGADDKAGIAEIMGAAAYIMAHNEIEHGTIEIIFTPDEETGAGLPCVPIEKITAKACYTLDGGPIGEFETECFNAYSAVVHFEGHEIHPGHARGVLVNAALMAANYAVLLPRSESPESTDGYYGYWALMEIEGNHEKAKLSMLVRDFDSKQMKRRLEALESFARTVEAQFPGGKVTLETKFSYSNMKDEIDKSPAVIEKLKTAAYNCGIDCIFKPIRGGTDGSRLTALGIPTPNIFTGGRNFHSRNEWVALDDMLAAAKLVVELVRLYCS
ncbi:MAG: peptidase T [Termitinemataceae bacterium]|nr:MAG: peptidase T [Termitinemataceae bacterium]